MRMWGNEIMNKITRKQRITLMGLLAVVVCLAMVNNSLNNEESMNTSSEYTDYEEQKMLEHDGDVLVDSLNIKAVAEDDATKGEEEANMDESQPSELVTSDDISELANGDAYMNEVRETINEDRNQVISMLTDVAAEAENTGEKERAVEQKLKIIEYMEQEKNIESIITTKGLPECLVLLTDNAVNVTVNKAQLDQTDVAKICDVIVRETERPTSQIVIQSKI